MRRAYIVGNWKMNLGTPDEAAAFARSLARKAVDPGPVDIGVAPPFTALAAVAGALRGSDIRLGAQNLSWEERGAFTGEVSAHMLKSLGVDFVLVGHSERRSLFGEHDDIVTAKLRAALQGGLDVIACLGEQLEEREAGKTAAVILRQLDAIVAGVDETADQARVTIAYEPVWAIGTGRTASVEQAVEAHKILRDRLAEHWGNHQAEATRIQYGGSVKPKNAAELMAGDGVDGALVGGASLKIEDFAAILGAARAPGA